MILLHIQISDLRMCVWLEVDNGFTVDPLSGTSFIDRYAQGIFPIEHKLVPWNSRPIELLNNEIRQAISYHLRIIVRYVSDRSF